MMSSTILICLILMLSYTSHPVYAEDSAIKQELLELESLIDEQPLGFFRDGMHGKMFFKQQLKQAILLVDDNRLGDIVNIINNLIIETDARFAIVMPVFRDKVRQRLIEILTKITSELAR